MVALRKLWVCRAGRLDLVSHCFDSLQNRKGATWSILVGSSRSTPTPVHVRGTGPVSVLLCPSALNNLFSGLHASAMYRTDIYTITSISIH